MLNQKSDYLKIGNTFLRLSFPGNKKPVRLLRSYSDFRVDEKNPYQFHVEIHLTSDLQTVNTPHPTTTFQDGIVFCAADGFSGTIDLQSGHADLSVSSQLQGYEIDYFLRVIVALNTFQNGGILFHAAGIEKEGRGYAFFGHSGSGKTTVCRITQNAKVLNDDLVCLFPADAGWKMFSTPFTNPTQVPPMNIQTDLAGLYYLVQNATNKIEPMSQSQAVSNLLANIPVLPINPAYVPDLITMIKDLIEHHPPKYLHFRPDPSFWSLIIHQT